jgi:hypothetical protein
MAAGGAVPVVPPWVVGGAGAAGAGSRLNWHSGEFGLNHYSSKVYVRRKVQGNVVVVFVDTSVLL